MNDNQKIIDSIKATELKLPEIRTYISEILVGEFEKFKYKFRKSDFTFKKKQKKDSISFTFYFHDYNPLKYDASFAISVLNNQIQEIKKQLTFDQFLGPTNWTSLYFPVSDFIESEKNKEINLRGSFSYDLVTQKDLFKTTEEMKNILREDALPLCEKLFSIEGLDKLFEERGMWWCVSSRSINNMTANLITAKLSGNRNYHILYEEMIRQINEYVERKIQHPSTLTAIKDLYSYLNKI